MAITLEGKSIIVTGAASGIGRAAAMLALEAGASVTMADIQEEQGRTACAEAISAGGKAQFVKVDVSDPQQVRNMIAMAVSTYGKLDCAFNNAAVTGNNIPFADLPEEQYQRVQSINLYGTFLCMKYEILQMKQHGGGAIVNTSSSAAISLLPNMADYGPAKSGVVAMTRAGALDHARDGIRVNAILPGPTRTHMYETGIKSDPQIEKYLTSRMPIGRIAEAAEVAKAALWLMSDDASIITGVPLPADGGLTIA